MPSSRSTAPSVSVKRSRPMPLSSFDLWPAHRHVHFRPYSEALGHVDVHIVAKKLWPRTATATEIEDGPAVREITHRNGRPALETWRSKCSPGQREPSSRQGTRTLHGGFTRQDLLVGRLWAVARSKNELATSFHRLDLLPSVSVPSEQVPATCV